MVQAYDQYVIELRTAPSGSYGAEISFRGLPDLVVVQLLFGLKVR